YPSWPVRYAAICRICCDQLLGIAIKRIDVQRHAVVKESESTAHNRPVRANRRPGKTCARGDARGSGDVLTFTTHAEIEGQFWTDDKMILSEECRFEITKVEPVRAREFDTP